jgi:hypothetical protein
MPAWSAHYVRVTDREADVARVRSRLEAAATFVDDGESAFVGWLLDNPSFEPEDLSQLSLAFDEVLAVTVQPIADMLVYDRFVQGVRARGLTYAGEAGWVRVLGDGEPWEAPALFSAAKLEELKLELEEDLEGDDLAREQSELDRLWGLRRLQEGNPRPPADPAAVVRAIEKHFKLPARPRA